MNKELQAREVVRSIWKGGLRSAEFDDPRTPEFASDALDELSELREETAGILEEALEGADLGASQLAVEDTHGLMELIQNADDQRASQIRFGIRSRMGRSQLVVVHNGTPIKIHDILAMCLAFVSTKRGDASTTGKFGIGLKTLYRLTDRIEVHCNPYHFAIVGNRIKKIPATRIKSFYSPQSADTLLVLPLKDEDLVPRVKEWAQAWEAHHMMFLRYLRRFAWVSIPSGRAAFSRRLNERNTEVSIPLWTGNKFVHVKASQLSDLSRKRQWMRYDVDFPVPKKLKRAFKETGESTTVSVAVPSSAAANVLYAGLPTKIGIDLPYAVGAAFDPNTARDQIQQDEWNKWLWKRVSALVTTVAIYLLEQSPSQAWKLVPTANDTSVAKDNWVEERMEELRATVCNAVQSRGRVLIGEEEVRLSQISYESEDLDSLLLKDDFLTLAPGYHALTSEARDSNGRWRVILDDLQVGKCLEVIDALELLNHCLERPLDRQPAWYARIISEALKAGLGSDLANLPCILVDDPIELVSPKSSGSLFSTNAVVTPLAARLGLVRKLHDSLLGECSLQGQIRLWLEDLGQLEHGLDATTVLEALGRRGNAESLELGDEDLTELRDLIDEVENPDEELLHRVGRTIRIESYQWTNGKRVFEKAPINVVYLPAGIAGGSEYWPKVAVRTPGLKWAAGRYGRLLDPGDRQSSKSGARRFLTLLGAHTIFQLDHQPYRRLRNGSAIDSRVPDSLREKFHSVAIRPKIIRNDYYSPDLEAVIDDICQDSTEERCERGQFLVRALSTNWRRSLQQRSYCSLFYFFRYEQTLGEIPSTWITRLTNSRWLCNEEGSPAMPRELAIKSPLSQRLFGDARSRFAEGIDDSLAPGLAAALGFEERPPASAIVDILSELREDSDCPEWTEVRRYYAYLAELCPDSSESIRHDTKVDDTTAGQIRGRFGIKRQAQGLLPVNGAWRTPTAVYRGRPIFGDRHSFVADDKAYRRLWNLLRIRIPDISNCVRVLREISSEANATTNASVLADTYRHISALLPEASAKDRRQLANLPLWTGTEWVETRPMYYIVDEIASESLAEGRAMWSPPCSLESMDHLVEALGVTVISPGDCTPIGLGLEELQSEDDLRDRFASAVDTLQDYLAKNDDDAYRSIELEWSELRNAKIAIVPQLGLEVTFPSGEQVAARTSAHLIKDPLTVCVTDEQSLFDLNAGARVISQCFGSLEHRRTVRLAWRDPGQNSLSSGSAMTLAADVLDEGDPLRDLEQLVTPKVGRRIVRDGTTQKRSNHNGNNTPLQPRRLKEVGTISIQSAEVINSNAPLGKQFRTRKTRAASPNRDGLKIGARATGSVAPLGYTAGEREQLALLVLEGVVRDHKSELTDFTHIQGLGADAGDEIGRLFEIKAHGGDIPDSVSIQPSQVRAARDNPSSFYLAVIGGLEEGYETVVRLFARPLDTLNWERGTSIKLSGIRSKRAFEVRLGTD